MIRPKRMLRRWLGKVREKTPVRRRIPVSKLLLGGEKSVYPKEYSNRIGRICRPSTPVIQGPHLDLLRLAGNDGEQFIRSEAFRKTMYFENARDCIRAYGSYFPYVRSEKDIELPALRFYRNYRGRTVDGLPYEGHSGSDSVLTVTRIQHSGCYHIFDGNHRTAAAIADGIETIDAIVLDHSETTPIQDLIASIAWESDSTALYQPLPYPELEDDYVTIRDCDARANRIIEFLRTLGLRSDASLVDLGAYYGYFAWRLANEGLQTIAVERDRVAIRLGQLTYPNQSFVWDDAYLHLQASPSYDVVLCLSIIHHFITGREAHELKQFITALDKATNRVLILDSGEEHESWFGDKLSGWSADAIESYMLEHTSFTHCYRLGRDNDGTGPYQGQFNRMLFAFVKP